MCKVYEYTFALKIDTFNLIIIIIIIIIIVILIKGLRQEDAAPESTHSAVFG